MGERVLVSELVMSISEQDRVMATGDAARDGELDLRAVGRALVRKRGWVLGPALAVAALTFVGVNLITPKYKSEARILIEGRENVFFRPDADKAAERDRTIDPEAITSQVQLALSRDVARQVIKALRLGELPEFDPALRGGSLMRKPLAEAEAKVDEFRSKTNLFIGTNNTTLSSQTLGESNRDLAAARSQKNELESKARFIRDLLKRGATLESADVINSELIRRLNQQRIT